MDVREVTAIVFLVLLVCCPVFRTASALTKDGGDLSGGWFGSAEAGAGSDSPSTTPIGDHMESVLAAADNDTVFYDDGGEYYEEEEEVTATDGGGSAAEPTTEGEATSTEEAPRTATTSARDGTNEIAGRGANRSTTLSKRAEPPRNVSSASKARSSSSGSGGKTGEVNYWQTDGASDQQASESSTASGMDEGRDIEETVSVKVHNRNPHPAAFTSGDGGWFGFGGGGGGGALASLSGRDWQSSKGFDESSASVAVENYQSNEQSASARSGELETVVEIKEHDELGPGAHEASSASDSQWFSNLGGNSKSSSSSGGDSGGDDAWFGVAASDWEPVAAPRHRQLRRLNWSEDPGPPSLPKDYEEVDIITAPPPGSDRSRDVFSVVVESSFGEQQPRDSGRSVSKFGLRSSESVDIITAPPDTDGGWFSKLLASVTAKKTDDVKPSSTTKTPSVRRRPSTAVPTGPPEVGVSNTASGPPLDNKHSFVNLFSKKSSVSGRQERPLVEEEVNERDFDTAEPFRPMTQEEQPKHTPDVAAWSGPVVVPRTSTTQVPQWKAATSMLEVITTVSPEWTATASAEIERPNDLSTQRVLKPNYDSGFSKPMPGKALNPSFKSAATEPSTQPDQKPNSGPFEASSGPVPKFNSNSGSSEDTPRQKPSSNSSEHPSGQKLNSDTGASEDTSRQKSISDSGASEGTSGHKSKSDSVAPEDTYGQKSNSDSGAPEDTYEQKLNSDSGASEVTSQQVPTSQTPAVVLKISSTIVPKLTSDVPLPTTKYPQSWYAHGDVPARVGTDEAVAVVVFGSRNDTRPLSSSSAPVTVVDVRPTTTPITTPRARSGRTFEDTDSLRHQNHEKKGPFRPTANFTAAAASSATSEMRPVASDSGALRGPTSLTSESLSYVLIGVCCAVCAACLVVAGAVLWYRRSHRLRRHTLRSEYAPAPYPMAPPCPHSRLGHLIPASWLDRSRKAGLRSPQAPQPPLDVSKTQLWFATPKQSPYSLCDQHLDSYCRNTSGAAVATDGPTFRRYGGMDSKLSGSPSEHRNRPVSEGGLGQSPSPTIYRSGFNGMSNLRHSSGLEYMNKGEMIYWSSNNEQLI